MGRTQLLKRWGAEMDPAVLPLDIIHMLGEKYRLREAELIHPSIRGLFDAWKEHRSEGE